MPSRPIEKALRARRFRHGARARRGRFAVRRGRRAGRAGAGPAGGGDGALPAGRPFRLPSILTPWTTPEIAAADRAERGQRGRRGAAARADRGDRRRWCPTGSTRTTGRRPDAGAIATPAASCTPSSTMRLSVRKRPLPLLAAVLAAQRRAARRLDGDPAADGLRRRQADAADAPLHLPARHAGHRHAGRPGRPGRSSRRSTARPTCSSRRRFLESFGIAALEARCAGLPVLAMRGTGITEFVADRVRACSPTATPGMTDALVEIARDDALLRRRSPSTTGPPRRRRLADGAGADRREYARAQAIQALARRNR